MTAARQPADLADAAPGLQLYTPEAVAEMVGTSKCYLRQLAREKEIRRVRLGKSKIMFRLDDIERFIAEHTVDIETAIPDQAAAIQPDAVDALGLSPISATALRRRGLGSDTPSRKLKRPTSRR